MFIDSVVPSVSIILYARNFVSLLRPETLAFITKIYVKRDFILVLNMQCNIIKTEMNNKQYYCTAL